MFKIAKLIKIFLFAIIMSATVYLPAFADQYVPPCPDGFTYVQEPGTRSDPLLDREGGGKRIFSNPQTNYRCDFLGIAPPIYIAIGIFGVAAVITLIVIKVKKSRKK